MTETAANPAISTNGTGDGSAPPTYQPIIRGEKIFLRPAEKSDVETFVRWFADSEMSGLLGMRAPMSLAMEEQWFTRAVEQQGKEHYHFVMCRMDNSQPIGTISLMHVDEVNGNAGVGISIGEKALWGKGYGTDAMNAILDFGFGQLRLERVWLDVYDYNVRARRSYEKSGFVVEGVQRHANYRLGKFHDVVLMAILHADWLALERKRSWDY
ncbi:MAG TPA: GNAT family protein [Candidatus Limnocylindrales bacterium]|jgi:RimJ/RimL family protein N-acetyltransferase